MPEQRTVKGSHIMQAQEWIDARLGPNTFKELTRVGGDRWGVVLPMAWYEVDLLNRVLGEASKRAGISVEDMTAEIARMNAEKDLTSIYRFFLRVAQPQRVLAYTPRLWRTYVSFGDAHAIKNERGHYIGRGDGLTAELVDWACGCWRGFIPATIEVSGGRHPKGRIVDRWRESGGSYSVQFEVTYG
jgi:hypothetical protein